MQVAERLYPNLMFLLNLAMSDVFGENNKPFVTITPRELLFSGITLCKPSSSVIGNIACDVIRGIAENARNIETKDDGSLVFSILDYVSFILILFLLPLSSSYSTENWSSG